MPIQPAEQHLIPLENAFIPVCVAAGSWARSIRSCVRCARAWHATEWSLPGL